MRNELTSDNLSNFRQRFGTFHDGVIHRVEYHAFTRTFKRARVIVGTVDLQFLPEHKWLNLIIEIEGVREIVLKDPSNYYLGVIFALRIDFFDNEFYIDFYPL